MTRPINTILAIGIIVVIAAIIGGVIWWQFSQQTEEVSPTSQVSPTGEQTSGEQTIEQSITQQQGQIDAYAGWKTYISEKWDYQIKYPANFYIKGNLNVGGLDFIVSDVQNIPVQDVGPDESVHVDVYTLPAEGKSLGEYVQGKGMQRILLSTIEAFQGSDDVHLLIYTKKGNFIYVIRGTNKSGSTPKIDVEKSWEIMKTFRFVD